GDDHGSRPRDRSPPRARRGTELPDDVPQSRRERTREERHRAQHRRGAAQDHRADAVERSGLGALEPGSRHRPRRSRARPHDPVFAIENAPTDVTLAAANAQTYSITFTPTEAKHFTAEIALYLDSDPTEQGTVKVSGDAVFVDAHGGGGCSAGGGAGFGAIVLV